jgi:4-amino-4-deoxy-L-arabinose transferase-like glycosyltransferase
VAQQEKGNQSRDFLILGIIWLLSGACDRIWFALDRAVPAWDQADYLTGTLNYWHALQQPQWFSGEWWTNFWQLSSKIPPLVYTLTALVQHLFGTGPERATLVLLLFNAILLASVYGLGVVLFDRRIGLWAAGLTVLLPGLYRYRVEFLLDFPLAAAVTASFGCLTAWWFNARKSWLWAGLFGLSLGLALMVKQTALFFLFLPILWLGVVALRHRYWKRLAQLIGSLLVSTLIFGPWYRTNWLLILTSGKRATIDAAIAEGQPPLNTLEAWLYYGKISPYLLSWVLLLVPIVGILLYWRRRELRSKAGENAPSPSRSLRWLMVFCVGGYLLSSLNLNKDARYILPLLPVLSLFLAYGLVHWKGRWGKNVRWGTLSLAILLMLFNRFPLGGANLTQLLSPRVQHHPYRGEEFPHTQVVEAIAQANPYLRSTLGVLPSTPTINQHNFNYYGALQNFHVYGRQVGTDEEHIAQDTRSLPWFLTKTGEQGSIPPAQAAITQAVETSPEFRLHRSWDLPDGSALRLYQRQQPLIQVERISPQLSNPKVRLERVAVPPKAPPGMPVPVSYEWRGSWEQLQSGIVLLTWQQGEVTQARWLHDRGIARGELHAISDRVAGEFRVIEQTSMLPPADLPPGSYTLKATYLNRQTGETYPIPVSPITLTLDPQAIALPAPEVDWVTQLRVLSANLPQGPNALEPVFEQTGRINQYDPIQDYVVQADLALTYRLKQEPDNSEWAYALAFTKVLQEDAEGAIAALQHVTQLDPQNPYAHAYLAFVYLYDWHPQAAEDALQPALKIAPQIPEVRALSGITALLHGRVFQAWQIFQDLEL